MSRRSLTALLSVGVISMYASLNATDTAIASCVKNECVEASCFKLGTETCTEYDYSIAVNTRSNAGGGTDTESNPEVLVKNRSRGSCTLECASGATVGKASCDGSTGDWGLSTQKKTYCLQSV